MTAHASNPATKFIDPKASMNIRNLELQELLTGVGVTLRSPRQCVLWSNAASAGVPLSPGERVGVRAGHVHTVPVPPHRGIPALDPSVLAELSSQRPPSPRPSPPGRGRRLPRQAPLSPTALRFSAASSAQTFRSPRQCVPWSNGASAGVTLASGERAGVRAGVLTLLSHHAASPTRGLRMRQPSMQFPEDRFLDLRLAPTQLAVPEPQRLETHAGEIGVFGHIPGLLLGESVLAAIQFNDQRGFFADEIHDEVALGDLAAKLVVLETPVAEPAPHEPFGPRLALAQLPGKWAQIHVAGVAKVGAVEKMEGGPPSPRPSPPVRGRRSRRPTTRSPEALRFTTASLPQTPRSPRHPRLWSHSALAGFPLSSGERVGVRAGVIHSRFESCRPRPVSTQ